MVRVVGVEPEPSSGAVEEAREGWAEKHSAADVTVSVEVKPDASSLGTAGTPKTPARHLGSKRTPLSRPSPLLACRASPPEPRFALPAQTEAPTDDIVFAVVKGLLEFIEKNPGKSDEWKSKADALQAEGWSVDN